MKEVNPVEQEKNLRYQIFEMIDKTDKALKLDKEKYDTLNSLNERVKEFFVSNDGKEAETRLEKPSPAVHVVVDKTKQAALVSLLKQKNLNDLYTDEDVSAAGVGGGRKAGVQSIPRPCPHTCAPEPPPAMCRTRTRSWSTWRPRWRPSLRALRRMRPG